MESAIAKIIRKLPELLADYEHLAADEDGHVDVQRKRQVAKFKAWLKSAVKQMK